MSDTRPDQTETETSMTFAAAKPATPSALGSERLSRASSVPMSLGSKGTAVNPVSASARMTALALRRAGSQRTATRFVERLARAYSTPFRPLSAPSTLRRQPAQCMPATTRSRRARPSSVLRTKRSGSMPGLSCAVAASFIGSSVAYDDALFLDEGFALCAARRNAHEPVACVFQIEGAFVSARRRFDEFHAGVLAGDNGAPERPLHGEPGNGCAACICE